MRTFLLTWNPSKWDWDSLENNTIPEEKYGEIGEGFIHIHHIVPIKNKGGNYTLDPVRDLRPVCPNCHAMLHREDPPLKIDELKKQLENRSSWVLMSTLGSKKKTFWWKLKDDFTLCIYREFKNDIKANKEISVQELESLINYVKKQDWVDLANNVQKISEGMEKEGLGKFLYEKLNWQIAEAQLASHLGSIFTQAGIWEYNGQVRGIKFKHKTDDWKNKLQKLYTEQLDQNN
ncbi:HNH endonuclease [Natranaerobius thermophilus]|uniref:HNH endonuclease n=1 Tax=Natranaerobius thermophilus (strain ATCC BAA-1301 / DSM 18059 / JW/NM-WN-LF) TaxID=457570 RepID=B2A7T7_NATTJ|nr:HNH endonuclease [Natranaerobius thermophilus]ACB84389.1 HNH endonuclease [Natranaerobius thermophilus JW/NM-WN-LF]